MSENGNASAERESLWARMPRLLDIGSVAAGSVCAAVRLIMLAFDGVWNLEVVAVALGAGAVILARTRPRLGLVVALTGMLVAALAVPPVAEWLIVIFTLFSITVRAIPAVTAGVAATLVTGTAFLYATSGSVPSVWVTVTVVTVTINTVVAASGLRAHQLYLRALQQRVKAAIATREAEAERRVAQERLRIARDLHDLVGHEVAGINMYLGVAEVSLPESAKDARTALTKARDHVQSVLRETQRVVRLLRPDEGAVRAPPPDALHLPALVASFRTLGLDVTVNGEFPTLSEGLFSGTVFRLLQEALTNALRHGTGTAIIALTRTLDALVIEVVNRHPAGTRPSPGTGLGLIGMRERVSLVGGRLDIDDDRRTYRVSIVLPLERGSLS